MKVSAAVSPDQRKNLEQIFQAGLQRVDPYTMILDHVALIGSVLHISMDKMKVRYDLDEFRQVLVLGAGKAAAPMARAIEHVLGERITGGVIVVKYGHTAPLITIETIEAGHPVPDEAGVRGTARVLEWADRADETTLVINLISGGGSALLPFPGACEHGEKIQLTLADKQTTTQALLACGADINEINCVRKHLSSVKGGRFLERISPARSLNLILSDVVGDDLSSIASGLTAADPTTFADALAVVSRYGIQNRVPEQVIRFLEAGARGDVPESLKEGAHALTLTCNVLLGTNRTALNAAAATAEKLGYSVVRLSSRITGEARDVARIFSALAADSREHQFLGPVPLCIISGGEPVVTLRGNGKGGRNQEMALAFLLEMQRQPHLFRDVFFLAASTDGNDGPTDAAGAFASLDLVADCEARDLDIAEFLNNNDAYTLFSLVSGLLKTGPTNTNVCDLHILTIV